MWSCDLNKVALQPKATLMKSHCDMGVLLQIYCTFAEHFFLNYAYALQHIFFKISSCCHCIKNEISHSAFLQQT